jgi:hypothetical protein
MAMADKPNLSLLLGAGEPIEEDDDEHEYGGDADEDGADDDDTRASEVVSLLDDAFDRKKSTSERYAAFAEAMALCAD